jgi:hypothetical protein
VGWLSAIGALLGAISKLAVAMALRRGGKDAVRRVAAENALARAGERRRIDDQVARLDDAAVRERLRKSAGRG